MTEAERDRELLEIKAMLKQICQVLGIGTVAPVKIVDIKLHAKRKAQEIMGKKNS
jgi:hypothetical protein